MNSNEITIFAPDQYYYDVKDQLKRHVYERSVRAFAAGDAARDAIKTPQALKKRQQWLRNELIKSMGGLPSSSTPLNPRIVGTIQQEGFRIEKVIFESRPKAFVTANLYVPDGITTPRGAVLFVSGHHPQAKHVEEYQIVCRYLAKAGLVVLAQDPIGQGERFSYYEKSLKGTTINCCCPEHDHAGSQCSALGDSLCRYFVHDIMRGVDYLCTRPEVDPKRIGITGNSGGGTQTCLMMMCDPRIAAAAPGTFVMNRQSYMYVGGAQDAEQIWRGMTALGWDHEDILLAMCPKPVRVLAVTYDFFPIEGTRRTVQRCKRFWKMLGQPGKVDLVEDVSTHCYTRNLARAAAEFFSQHLLGKKVTPRDEDIQPIEPSQLWCTQSGQVRGELPGARFVYEENLDRLTLLTKQRKQLSQKKKNDWLREKIFAGRKKCDLNLRVYYTPRINNLAIQAGLWFSQEDICNYGVMFRDFRQSESKTPVTLAVWNNGTQAAADHAPWIRKTCQAGRAVLVLDVSGMGCLEPSILNGPSAREFYGALHKLNDDLFWLDDSLAAMRVYDVLRAVELIEQWPGLDSSDLRFYTHGTAGMYVRLAALLDNRIKKIESVEGWKNYSDWVKTRYYDSTDIRSLIIPGLLKYFD